jgi:hypothetical protein
LLALEREQIVAVAGRVAELDVGDRARALIRQTLVWIWKDEQLHAARSWTPGRTCGARKYDSNG